MTIYNTCFITAFHILSNHKKINNFMFQAKTVNMETWKTVKYNRYIELKQYSYCMYIIFIDK